MPLYRYKILDQEGHATKSVGIFDSPEELEDSVEQQGYFLISCKLFRMRPWQRFSLQEQAHFCEHMATFLSTTLSLMEALASYQKHHPKYQKSLALIQQQLTRGKTLGEALSSLPILPELLTHTLSIAERSGKLAECFQHMATYCLTQHKNREQLQRALSYPFFLCALLLIALICLAPPFVRDMQQFLQQMGHDQAPSLLLKVARKISKITLQESLLYMSMAILTLMLARKVPRPSCLYGISFRLHRTSILQHFFQMLSLQLDSGMHLMEALETQATLNHSPVIQRFLQEVIQDLEKGALLSETLAQKARPFPMIIPLLTLAESTGSLKVSFEKISLFLAKKQADRRAFILSHIQPLFLGLIGLFLIGVVVSLFRPLYEVVGNMAL